MNNFDLKQNFSQVVYGGTLSIIILIVGYSFYVKFNTPNLAQSEYLTGSNFAILVEFQKKNVSFKTVPNLIDQTLKPLFDYVAPVVPSPSSGRSNPFTP